MILQKLFLSDKNFQFDKKKPSNANRVELALRNVKTPELKKHEKRCFSNPKTQLVENTKKYFFPKRIQSENRSYKERSSQLHFQDNKQSARNSSRISSRYFSRVSRSCEISGKLKNNMNKQSNVDLQVNTKQRQPLWKNQALAQSKEEDFFEARQIVEKDKAAIKKQWLLGMMLHKTKHEFRKSQNPQYLKVSSYQSRISGSRQIPKTSHNLREPYHLVEHSYNQKKEKNEKKQKKKYYRQRRPSLLAFRKKSEDVIEPW